LNYFLKMNEDTYTVWQLILPKLDLLDWLSLNGTCRSLNLLLDNEFWKQQYQKDFGEPDKIFQSQPPNKKFWKLRFVALKKKDYCYKLEEIGSDPFVFRFLPLSQIIVYYQEQIEEAQRQIQLKRSMDLFEFAFQIYTYLKKI